MAAIRPDRRHRQALMQTTERLIPVMNSTITPASYFERVGAHRFVPTVHARGAWAVDEQHFSPLGGLIVHEIERMRARERCAGLLVSRISFDILGRNTFEEFDIHVEVIRPGRTIELVGATVVIAGRSTVSARVWLMAAEETGLVAGGEPDGMPAPETLSSWPLTSVWPGGYVGSLDTRPIGIPQPGRTAAWLSTPHGLVAGEQASGLASFVALVDTANGIAVRQEPAKWMFPNLDLTIHLYRQPEAGWTGLDTTVTFGHAGQGLTSTVLHDIHGPVGSAQQILTVRPQHDGGR
ncbi:thioesterase family protein [Nocardia acidivorans]|uniref:thioesterase family protein n=1 Tax=Nocardia acidivorans TaxID=404580 RepID=UPI000AFF6F9C|nr:thioesterase family protein [Nocardia acidivorans]